MQKRWSVVAVAYIVLLTILLLRPGSDVDPQYVWKEIFDNFMHIPAFAVLAFLLLKSLPRQFPRPEVRVFASAFSYGVLIEIGQSFVPTRYASVGDVILNSIGILIMLYIDSRNKSGTLGNR